MSTLPKTLNFVVVVALWATVPASAQWAGVKTKGVPLSRDGKPNLNAPAPRKADGKTPDLSGVWHPVGVPCDELKGGMDFGCSDVPPFGIPIGVIDVTSTRPEELESGSKEGLPYQPWAEALVKQRTVNEGKDDPGARCLPLNPVVQWAGFSYQKIAQTEEAVIILGEYMAQYRQIFLDGRPVPEDPNPTFKGYSVAHWEGDTLVVDTRGFKDGLWLDVKGHPLTDWGRTTERIRRVDYGNLEVQITIDDPKAYTKPFTVTRRLKLALDTELIDYICNENEKSLAHMVGK